MKVLDKCFWCKECDERSFHELPRGEWGHKCMAKHINTHEPIIECESFIDVIEGIPTVDAVIDDCGHTLGYICKGHDVTPEQFAAGIWWNEGEDCPVDIDDIRERLNRFIYRCIPKPPGDESSWSYTYEHSKPGRGAFKCSVYYLG